MPEELKKELQDELKSLVDTLQRECKSTRSQQTKLWKKCENFWHGIQYIYWDDDTQEWVSPSGSNLSLTNIDDEMGSDATFYDYVINIYKPHGESIISALSAQIPVVTFPPDDAEDNEDIQTSKTYTKIAVLLQKHNNAKLMLLEILFRFFNQGGCIAYCYKDKNKKYGTHKVPKYSTRKEDKFDCPNCGSDVSSIVKNFEGGDDSPEVSCPNCSQPIQPEFLQGREEDIPFIKEYVDEPKSRLRIDLYGPINAQYPTYAINQDGCGYIILQTDHHSAMLKEIYPDIADKIGERSRTDSERSIRGPSYFGERDSSNEDMKDLVTLKRVWLRPWQLNQITDKDHREELRELYPDGIKVTWCGDTFAEAVNEDIDEHIVIGKAGLSSHIHADPLGKPLLSNNEIRNILLNITLDTIEHAIPSTFADSEVVNLVAYQAETVRPGSIYPCKTKPGKSIAEAFYTEPRSTLGREVSPFGQLLDQDAQFTVGDFPSIYGGPMSKNRTTATEYNKSQQAALQRLGNAWVMLLSFWQKIFDMSVRLFVKTMVDDEKYTQKQADGSYINVWIRRSMLQGKVGEVEPETNENFPMSSSQKQQLILQLLQLNNDLVNAAMSDPNNAEILTDALSLSDFKIPGEVQRFKQAREIQDLSLGEPVQGQDGNLTPSVPIDPDVDDHMIHKEVLVSYLCDTPGLDLQKSNPKGYMNCIAHLRAHAQVQEQQAQQQAQEQQAQQQQRKQK